MGSLLPHVLEPGTAELCILNRIFGIETEYGLLVNQDRPDHSPSSGWRNASGTTSFIVARRGVLIFTIVGMMSRQATGVS